MEFVQHTTCAIERGQINAEDETLVQIQVHWVPFFDCVRILGRVGYDLESDSADFHFAWYEDIRSLLVYQPYKWIHCGSEHAAHRGRFECVREEDSMREGSVPYYRFPRTGSGTTLIEILEVLFEGRGGLPPRIVLL